MNDYQSCDTDERIEDWLAEMLVDNHCPCCKADINVHYPGCQLAVDMHEAFDRQRHRHQKERQEASE